MTLERKYLPTIAELIDRLCIDLLKVIHADRDTAREEMQMIIDDLHSILDSPNNDYNYVAMIYPVIVLAVVNYAIWMNEDKARFGDASQNDRLLFTHSLNGVRNRAKNEIAKVLGEREDKKVDCLAADVQNQTEHLAQEAFARFYQFGNWRVFDDEG